MKRIFLIMFFILFSFQSQAAEDQCGLEENGKIKPFSVEICKEDTALNMAYSLLGSLYDEYVFPLGYTKFVDSEKIKSNQDEYSDYYKRFGIIFKDIFNAMHYITISILSILIPYYLISVIFNSSSGDFLGKGWDKVATTKRLASGIFLLTPINGISIAQIIILNLSLFSIAGANFALSGFLSFMEYQIPEVREVGEFDSQIDSVDETSIYWDYALMDVKKMTKIAMCRNRTSQYLLEKQLIVGDNMDEFIKCNSPTPSNISTDSLNNGAMNIKNENSFINYNLEESKDTVDDSFFGGSTYNVISTSVNFGNTKAESCKSEYTYEYSCATLKFPNFSINLEGMDISKVELDRLIINYAESISLSSSIDQVINSKWDSFWLKVINGNEHYESLSEISKRNKRKILSYYFHQMVQSHLLNGVLYGERDVGPVFNIFNMFEPEIVNIKNNKELKITEKMDFVNDLAKKIETLDCIGMGSDLSKVENSINKIKNKTSSTQVSAKCLYYDASGELEVLGMIDGSLPIIRKETQKEDSAKIENYINTLVDDSEIDIRKVANKIYLIKKGIMHSFNNTLNINSSVDGSVFQGNILVQARKMGWGSLGSLMRRIVQEKDSESKFQKSLLIGLDYTENMGHNMVSTSIDQSELIYPNLNNKVNLMFNSFYNNTKIRKVENLSVVKYIGSYIEQQQNNYQQTTALGLLSDITGLLSKNVTQFKSSMGIGDIKHKDDANSELEECLNGNSSCGIPLIHPMQTISKMGKDMVSFSVGVIAANFTLIQMKSIKFNGSNDAVVKDGGKDATSDEKAKKKKLGKTKKALKKSLGPLGSLVGGDIYTQILDMFTGLFILLAFVGIFMAYVLPLIPFFIFAMAIIGWVVMLFQILVISNIWIALLFQPKSQGENREGIQAAYNAIMQLMLRPALITVSLILAWWMFTVLIMVVNLSIGPLFASLTTTSHILGLINLTFGLTFYAIIIYIVTKVSFKMVDDLPQKVFSTIGVKSTTENDEKMNGMVEAMSAAITYRALSQITQGQNQSLKGKNQASKEKKREDQGLHDDDDDPIFDPNDNDNNGGNK